MIEIDGVPLRDYLIAQAGLQKYRRVTEDGRRVQYSDTGFLSRPRVEIARSVAGTILCVVVPSRNTHTPRTPYGSSSEPLIEKFMRRVEKSEDGHWRWTGHLTRQGYGRFSVKVDGKNKTVAAHRWIYEYLVRPLDPEETIDHLNEICGVRNCVNVEHLDPCSGGENARRGRIRLSLADKKKCGNKHILVEVGTRIDERGTVLCIQCENDKASRSRASFFTRRATVCYQLNLPYIVCNYGHRLDLENSLLKSGLCRECHRLTAQRSRDLKKASSEDPKPIRD